MHVYSCYSQAMHEVQANTLEKDEAAPFKQEADAGTQVTSLCLLRRAHAASYAQTLLYMTERQTTLPKA